MKDHDRFVVDLRPALMLCTIMICAAACSGVFFAAQYLNSEGPSWMQGRYCVYCPECGKTPPDQYCKSYHDCHDGWSVPLIMMCVVAVVVALLSTVTVFCISFDPPSTTNSH